MTRPSHEILRRAKEVLTKHWTKGHYRDIQLNGSSRYCLIGGVQCALNENYIIGQRRARLELEIRQTLRTCINRLYPDVGITGWSAESFNDAPTTQHHHVMAVLDCAIKDTTPQEPQQSGEAKP